MPRDSIAPLHDQFLQSTGVFTDTRKPIEGGVFFALSGPNFNGNLFAEKALQLGAVAAVVDDPKLQKDDRYILVEDCLESLQELARYHRNSFDIPVLALTGSNGKTTTKELLAAVLSRKFNIIATEGNLNNHIGVPLTLLKMSKGVELAIIEMGANHQGEIKVLSEIARPSHGLITNIGKAHIEGFGGVEGIKKGKKELYDFLAREGQTIFINQSDQVLMELLPPGAKEVYYGKDDSCQLVEVQPFVTIKLTGNDVITTQLIGTYNYSNALTAIGVGQYFGVPDEEIAHAIASYVPEMNRSQVIKRKSNTIILDAYNANPDSMAAALKSLEELEAANKVVILGDMLELGEEAMEEHKLLGKRVGEVNPVLSLFCGSLVQASADQVSGSRYFQDKQMLAQYLERHPIQDSTILVKASRGIGLETIVDLL